MPLETYNRKRDFSATPEPAGKAARRSAHRFVVQEHHASKLHFDFRLEMGGVLKSWAVPKGPSLDPRQKRLAVMVEDHPVSYIGFEGKIGEGNYGAGEVFVWDSGRYDLASGDDSLAALEEGRLSFRLHGEKLRGEFHLVRMKDHGAGEGSQWLLMKTRDAGADPAWRLKLVGPAEPSAAVPTSKQAEKPKIAAAKPRPQRRELQGTAVPVEELFSRRTLRGDAVVETGKQKVALTSLDKVYWPDEGYSKCDLLRYYYQIADTILPYLKQRPLILQRYPSGIRGHSFFQHNVEDPPSFVRAYTTEVEGETVHYAVCDNLATLLYLANLGAIAFNPWHSRTSRIDRPDWFVFDLDPDQVPFSAVCDAALAIRQTLKEVGLNSFAKTSGASGMHVYVPIKASYTYDEVAPFAERVAKRVAAQRPDLVTLERSLKQREGSRIYLDHLQNAEGKSVVAPYAVRARPGATVSAPLDWAEVERCPALSDFTVKTLPQRLKRKGDLFSPVLNTRQDLSAACRKADKLWPAPRRGSGARS